MLLLCGLKSELSMGSGQLDLALSPLQSGGVFIGPEIAVPSFIPLYFIKNLIIDYPWNFMLHH